METLSLMFEFGLFKLKKNRFFGIWKWEVTLKTLNIITTSDNSGKCIQPPTHLLLMPL